MDSMRVIPSEMEGNSIVAVAEIVFAYTTFKKSKHLQDFLLWNCHHHKTGVLRRPRSGPCPLARDNEPIRSVTEFVFANQNYLKFKSILAALAAGLTIMGKGQKRSQDNHK